MRIPVLVGRQVDRLSGNLAELCNSSEEYRQGRDRCPWGRMRDGICPRGRMEDGIDIPGEG